jgi:hypothetical protein
MPRPKPAKERPVQVATICNLTDHYFLKEFNYGNYPVFPVIPGVQYVVRCAASIDREESRDRKVRLINPEAGGAPKELIRECAHGEEFALTEIADNFAVRQEMGGPEGQNNVIVREPIGAYDIADDIVKGLTSTYILPMFTEETVEKFLGLFVCNDERPTAEELKNARAKLKACDEAMVKGADTSFATYKNRMFTMEAAAAAKRLKIEDRDWLSVYQPTKECPMCFTKLDPRAVVCKQCNFVLDPKKAVEMGYLKPEPEPKPHKTA